MLFVERLMPKTLAPHELDRYLQQGWYRLGSEIFTCRYLVFDGELFSPIWLRVDLQGYTFPKRLRKIIRRNERLFTFEYRLFQLTEAHEALYERYREHFDGGLSPTLKVYLQDGAESHPYRSLETVVYFQGRMVAYSVFDVGGESLASIIGVYDPAFAKYSLGLYTMLLEVQYGMRKGYRYFYPGYVVPGYARFDYKLRLGDMQFLDPFTERWQPVAQLHPERLPSLQLKNQTISLLNAFDLLEVPFHLMFYYHVELPIGGFPPKRTLNAPLFLQCFPQTWRTPRIIAFADIWEGCFRLCECKPMPLLEDFLFEDLEADPDEPGLITQDIVLRKTLFEHTDPLEIARFTSKLNYRYFQSGKHGDL
ncbi:MAG: GNAT family N-acetyltransferase [Bacteroidetes bacterium]|nr:MAG: GNAT family N-acetyltransferase [Bacteroidota bacterium]